MNANRQVGVADKKTFFRALGWCKNGFDLFISVIESLVGSVGQMACQLGVPDLSHSAHFSRRCHVGQLSVGRMKSISGTSVLGSVFLFFFKKIIYFNWRLITLQYCSGFCHILTRISHGFTCVPHPEPPSHLPPHPIPLVHPSAPAPSMCLMHPTWTGDLFHTW